MASLAAPQPGERTDPLVEPALTRSGAARVLAVDRLRGLMIVLMVLDHVRDFFGNNAFAFDPTDPALTTPALFATRWVTHLCAPTFVLLAGVSIGLQHRNGKRGAALSAFLLKRGAWLILLDATVVSFGFNFGWPFLFLQVIWAIGASMIAMAALSRLPGRVVLGLGVLLVALHLLGTLAFLHAEGAAGAFGRLVFVPGPFPGTPGFVAYPFAGWLGIMCIGFGIAPLFEREPRVQARALLIAAACLLTGFLLLRALQFGDQEPWTGQATPWRTVLSFLNVSKYPPAPDYVLATLGCSCLLFVGLQRLGGPAGRVLLTFGRTPLFTYLCHIYIAHGLALLIVLLMGGPTEAELNILMHGLFGPAPPPWGFSLPLVYLAWVTVLVLLYPLSRWMEALKRRRRDPWLSYI